MHTQRCLLLTRLVVTDTQRKASGHRVGPHLTLWQRDGRRERCAHTHIPESSSELSTTGPNAASSPLRRRGPFAAASLGPIVTSGLLLRDRKWMSSSVNTNKQKGTRTRPTRRRPIRLPLKSHQGNDGRRVLWVLTRPARAADWC